MVDNSDSNAAAVVEDFAKLQFGPDFEDIHSTLFTCTGSCLSYNIVNLHDACGCMHALRSLTRLLQTYFY
jgi:hypothetical protein